MVELRWVGATWILTAAGGLAVLAALGSVDELTALDAAGTALLFGLSVAGALGALVLGRRSPPRAAYWQVLELCFAAPEHVRPEPAARTARRAVLAGAAAAVGMAAAAVVTLAMTLALLGKPRAELSRHLLDGAALVAVGWTLVCAAAALVVAAWFERWERRRGKLVLCWPLRSGSMLQIYLIAPRDGADAG